MYPALQSYFMSIDRPPVVLKRFYESSLSELYLKHLQSFVAVFNEQVQNIERSKASVIEVRSCLDVVKSTIKERQKQMFISTQVKSKLDKLREEGQNHECDLFISDVSVLYQSCVEYLDKWTTLLKSFNALTGCSYCKQSHGKKLNHVWSICFIKMSILMKLNCLTNIKTSANS